VTVTFQALVETPLAVSAEHVLEAFKPFLCPKASTAERAALTRRVRYNAARRAFGRVLHGEAHSGNRSKAVISGEYEDAWSRGFAAYDLALGCRKPEPWLFRGEPLMADRAGVPRFRSVILAAALRCLKPRRVLEVGCGNGINLLLLANAFPEIAFTGLELTEAGNRVALDLQTTERLPPPLAAYAPEPAVDPSAFRLIDFRRGDATQMPFADGEFDLVFSVLAVEQMERVRERALREIARVAKSHVLNLEPFAEANRSPWRRLHVFARDYFRGTIAGMAAYGLEPQWATVDFPQEIQLGAALVLSRKQG
jgi:SAM-dependent methyltransferase